MPRALSKPGAIVTCGLAGAFLLLGVSCAEGQVPTVPGLNGDSTPTPTVGARPQPTSTPGGTEVPGGTAPTATSGARTPTPMTGMTPTAGTGTPVAGGAGQQGLALTFLEEVENSNWHGTAILTGTVQTNLKGSKSAIVLTLRDAGGLGILAPGAQDIGHAVILSGTCENPLGIARDLGTLLPVLKGGMIAGQVDGYRQVVQGTPTPPPVIGTPGAATPTPNPGGSESIGWAIVDTVPLGVSGLTHGVFSVAVLTNDFDENPLRDLALADEDLDVDIFTPEGQLNEQFFREDDRFDQPLREVLREEMLACGSVAAQSLIVATGTTSGQGTATPAAGTPSPQMASPTPRVATPTP